MANEEIKKSLKSAGMYQWELANELGVSEGTLTRYLRKEISSADKHEILEIIRKFRKSKSFGDE